MVVGCVASLVGNEAVRAGEYVTPRGRPSIDGRLSYYICTMWMPDGRLTTRPSKASFLLDGRIAACIHSSPSRDSGQGFAIRAIGHASAMQGGHLQLQ